MRNILFSGNERVFDGILSCMLSILKRTETTEPFRFYIYTMDMTRIKPEYTPITREAAEFLQHTAKGYNPENEVTVLDVTDTYEREFAYCPNEDAYCSPYTLLRLFADIIPGMPDKLLYLDVDILFQRDICLLYDTDVSAVEYAAARDHYGKYLLNPNYINAGVLLLNMKEIRNSGLFVKARKLIQTKKLVFADQSAIIRSTTGKRMLPQRFNDQKFLHRWTVVRHFSKRLFYLPYPHTANIKQWDVSSVHRVFHYYAFDDILYDYIYLKKQYERMQEEKMNKRIPIFYACDDNFVKYTAVSLRSIMDNASKNRKYTVHVLNTNISDDMKQVLNEMQNEQFEVRFDDVTDYLRSISDKLPLRDYYSKTTYFRLFIAEMYPEYDKAIYIDSDTIVTGDIAELYDYELGDNYVGACNEQVMIQEDVYGTYVEQVLGIERDNYFNAGMLVINCEQFRKNKVLDSFIELLHTYNFVVTQDEDYLNLICHNKVCFLPQKWNVEVFGTLACKEEDICMLHYIMVSKPWHYSDCRMKEYFWKYAEKTVVYDSIMEVLSSYTKEEKERDAASCERLLKLAQEETAKENNYLKLLKAGKLKERGRLEVLDKIAKFEREGRFDEDVEEDPPTRELKPREIDYLRTKLSSRIKTKLTYKVARSFLNNILDSKQLIIKDIKGIENMNALESGAVITCNHFNAFDSFAIQIAYEKSNQCKKRRLYRVIREGNYTNFPGFYGMLMRNCYTFPLSSNKDTMKKFMRSMDKVLQHGDFMVVYPEQSMWWNYRKPKPLKKGAYTFAAKNNVPVLPCFITMEDSDIIGEDGFFVQEYTIHIAPPIYPMEDKSRAENIAYMKDKNYAVWKEIYETTYGEPLVYTCEEMQEKKTIA